MRRLKLAGLVAVFTVLVGGSSLLAPSEARAHASVDCTERQITYIKESIREECGIWGGRAYATCDGYSITIHSIECYAD